MHAILSLRFYSFVSLLLLLGSGGCSSSDVVPVKGKVTLSGQPLTSGSVVFEDRARGISVFAPIQKDGSYTIQTHAAAGLPPGKYLVGITTSEIGSGENILVAPPTPPPPKPPGPSAPEKYWNPTTSGLTAEVKSDQRESIDFQLVE